MNERLFEHPNFVWLEKEAVHELLTRRKPANCDAMVVYNNLLRWSLYQIDRTACNDNEEKSAEIPIERRLQWITDCKEGRIEHVTKKDLEKYLGRGMMYMPWEELSQKDFLQYVVPYSVLSEEELLSQSIKIMEVVVKNPKRLHNSAFHASIEAAMMHNGVTRTPSSASLIGGSPQTPRKNLSRTNSLRRSIKEVKLRNVASEKGSRPSSMVIAC